MTPGTTGRRRRSPSATRTGPSNAPRPWSARMHAHGSSSCAIFLYRIRMSKSQRLQVVQFQPFARPSTDLSPTCISWPERKRVLRTKGLLGALPRRSRTFLHRPQSSNAAPRPTLAHNSPTTTHKLKLSSYAILNPKLPPSGEWIAQPGSLSPCA